MLNNSCVSLAAVCESRVGVLSHETVGLRPGLVACSHRTNWVELKYMLSTA